MAISSKKAYPQHTDISFQNELFFSNVKKVGGYYMVLVFCPVFFNVSERDKYR